MNAHFTLQHMPLHERQNTLREAHRVLLPGRSITIVEIGQWGPELRHELQEAGFKVDMKMVSPNELRKLDTDNAYANASRLDEQIHTRLAIPKIIPRELQKKLGARTRKEVVEQDQREAIAITRREMIKLEGNDGPATQTVIRRMIEGLKLNYSDRPFCVIRAMKPLR
jgi:hypothetical protein